MSDINSGIVALGEGGRGLVLYGGGGGGVELLRFVWVSMSFCSWWRRGSGGDIMNKQTQC